MRLLPGLLLALMSCVCASGQQCWKLEGAQVNGASVVCLGAAQLPGVVISGITTPILAGTYQYNAVVSGNTNGAVAWGVNGIVGGNSTVGTITTAGLYTAPPGMPTVDVSITATSVANPSAAGALQIAVAHGVPPQATTSGVLEGKSNWTCNHDAGTPGTATVTRTYPVTIAGKTAMEMVTAYTDKGGGICHISWGADTTASHFIYDTFVYLVNPTLISQIEIDMNQVQATGSMQNTACTGTKSCTQIFGTQCDATGNGSGTPSWDVTYTNTGSHWIRTNVPCNPLTLTANTWHHLQAASHRDNAGHITYDWVMVDGVYGDITLNGTQTSTLGLGWSPIGDLLINFQLDGSKGSSTDSTVYTHTTYVSAIQIWRW